MAYGSNLLNNSRLIRILKLRLVRAERGQSLAEMAIALLIMLPLTFGIIDFSRGVYTASVISAAAQEGARAGIIDESSIMGAIQSKMMGLNMDLADVDIDTSQPEIVAVNISYDFSFVTPIVDSLADTLELTGSASMIKQ